jgi:class 3 adenylate cyclase/tetratricopeptide (TPR) repeat protein
VTTRRDITVVVVVDIVGSTELREHIGEPRFEAIYREFETAGRRILANHAGELVKGQGDGFIAAFGSVSEALAAGIGILQAATSSNRRRVDDEWLRLRVGISAGETEWYDGDLTGIVPVEATRLEQAAQPDTILCSELVRALAAKSSEHLFGEERDLQLKGLRARTKAWEVRWRTVTASQQLGLPEALATTSSRLKFVGRGNELVRLMASWDTARSGHGHVVTIAGEPGVGKTRLCSEFSQRVLDDRGIVLYGRCDRVVAFPYQPFVEALQRYVRHAPNLELLPADGATELARLVPELHQRLPGLGAPAVADSDTQRYRLFEAIADWLMFVAREEPVLLILDDVTWATAPTLAMLHQIAPRIAEGAVLCVATYRPQEASDDLRDVLTAAHRRRPVETVALRGLDQEDVLAALRGLLGESALHPTVAALGAQIWRESGGNPLFVGELFAKLLESGSIRRGEHGWTASVGPDAITIPAAVGDVVLARKRALSAPTQQLLDAASVAGLVFDPAIVQEVVDLSPGVLADALDEAEQAGLVRCPGDEEYEFSHALVRDVLYDEQSRYRRALVHEAMARAIEGAHASDLGDHADDLALHYSFSPTPDGAARAVRYGAVAAERASDRFAHGEAVLHYQRAIRSLPRARLAERDQVHCRLIVDLGIAQHRAGDPSALHTLLEGSRLAAAAGDGALCARALLAGSRGIFSSTGSVEQERVDGLRSALSLVGDKDSRVRAMLLANLSVELSFAGDHEEPDRLSDEATAMARRLGGPSALVPVLALRMVTLWRANRMRERLILASELEQLCTRYGRPQATLLAATMGCQAAMEAGEFETADRRLATIDEISAALHQPLSLGYARLRQSMRAAIDGRLDDSERLADEAYQCAKASGQPDAYAFWVGQVFNIRFHQGRLDEIADELAATADAYPGIVAFRAAIAMVATELERFDEARSGLDAIFGASGTGVPDDLNWLTTIAFATQAAARLGDQPLCAVLVQELLPYRDQFVDNASTFFGSVERYLGLALSCLNRHDEAGVSFERAVAIHARLGAPILLARTRLEWGEAMVRANGGPTGDAMAKAQMDEALAVADRLDLRAISRRARSALASVGA